MYQEDDCFRLLGNELRAHLAVPECGTLPAQTTLEERGPRVLYRLNDYAGGINCRPMRFVHGIPKESECSLCHLIPKMTVQLPCSHFLCGLCYQAILREDNGICPLDRTSFHRKSCHSISLPNWELTTAKAHCWNEANGCDYAGTIASIMIHSENCDWHSFQCPRCTRMILRKHLRQHIWDECTITPDLHRHSSLMQDPRLIIHAVSDAARELKQLIREPLQDHLPVLQTNLNALTEQSKEHSLQLGEIVRELRDSRLHSKHEVEKIANNISSALRRENEVLIEYSKSQVMKLLEITDKLKAYEHSLQDEVMQTAREISSMVSRALESWLNSTAEQRRGTPKAEAIGTPLPWKTEIMLILRKLERLGDVSLSALEQLRQKSNALGENPAIASCQPLMRDLSGLREQVDTLSPPPWERFNRGSHTYLVTLQNADKIFSSPLPREWTLITEVTQWHGQDAYFTLFFAIMHCTLGPCLGVWIKLFSIVGTSRSRVKGVCVMHRDREQDLQMVESQFFTPCSSADDTFCGYEARLSELSDEGFRDDDKMLFSVLLTDEQADVRDFPLAKSFSLF